MGKDRLTLFTFYCRYTKEMKMRGEIEGGRDRKGTPLGPGKRERHTQSKQRRKDE